MTNRFYCPHCKGLLNPGTKVIFVIERDSERGLILLSPELGDYAVVLAEAASQGKTPTAHWAHLPYEFLDLVSRRIIISSW